MALKMEPGQVYNTWAEFKEALDTHCRDNKVIFNISNAKTVEQANNLLKKKPYFDIRLKYASCLLVCKHFGSYKSLSAGIRPKQRSYKINCKAYISVSACRKENYLIIRDSYHIHSHPCTEEIFNSYPEIRRMTKEERKMVGTLMDLGVPTAQIKTAVGRHVTPKDLQNAKTHIKAVKLGLRNDEPRSGPRRRKTFKELQEARREARKQAGESVSDSDEEKGEMLRQNTMSDEKVQNSKEAGSSSDVDNPMYSVTVDDNGHVLSGSDSVTVIETQAAGDKDGGHGDLGGLSGLLAAAGISSDSVVLTVNNQGLGRGLEGGDDNDKNSYTVTVSLPDGEVTQTGTNLKELLKGLPLGKAISKSSSAATSPMKIKSEEADSIIPQSKQCSKCGGYISPLDGHAQCLSCLGPDHIHEHNCEHCNAMTPEQFNIRRKKMVALRMKALKEMQRKRRQEDDQSDEVVDSDSDYSPSIRKSKRARRPKQYGADIAVESSFILGGSNLRKAQNLPHLKMALEDSGRPGFSAPVPKTEPLEDYEFGYSNDEVYEYRSDTKTSVLPRNSQRFEHILSQTKVFDDVQLKEHKNGSSCFIPEESVVSQFERLVARPNISATLPTLLGKYLLDPKFESRFCTEVPPLSDVADPGVDNMSQGLSKLATNAAVQTRVAVYDKLFTRLGMGMADEALSILSELYGRVTEVTEISQEDLTNSLQTALDTIQALKDVLEELGVMSKDAITNAAHQRSLSVNSLNAARKSFKTQRTPAVSTVRRGKFLPFSRTQIIPHTKETEHIITSQPYGVSTPSTSSATAASSILASDQQQIEAAISSSHMDTNVSELPIMTIATTQDGLDINPETSTAFISMAGKEFTMAPLTVSNELLQSLTTNKEGIIELHVLKDETELIDTEEAPVEEVIHTE